MKTKTSLVACAALVFLSTFNFQLSTFAQGTAFTYQGRLTSGTNIANGRYDLNFSLFNVVSGAGQISSTLTNTATAVSNGLFSVALDFGANFTGADRWLEIAVRTNGVGAFTNLAPRQQITPTPYAMYSDAAARANFVAAANISGTVQLSQLPNTILTNNATGVILNGSFTGNGAGVTNILIGTLSAPGILTWPGYFVLASSPAAGSQPRSVVAADVNGDGKLDLICANSSGGSLTIFTNNGSGGFSPSSTNSVPNNSRSVVASDVNGDGKPDLICTSQSPGALIVLTNNGSGGFVAASTNSTGPGAGNVQMVVAADVNADGKPDLISANGNSSPGTLTVFTNNGSGGFGLASSNNVGNNPFAVAVADVNGDGWPDLIGANNNSPGTLSVLTNNGSGGFVSASTNSVGNSPRSVTAADVNGDGKLDLISANIGAATLSVLLNNGSGGFLPAVPISAGTSPAWVTAADLNGDGKVDLICANNTSPGTLTAVTNDGSGGFLPAFTNSVGSVPYAVITADVNGDSKLDLISVNGTSPGTLSVLFNLTTFTGSFAGNGAGLTVLNASQLASGTVADARLSANVPLLNGSAAFVGTVQATTFSGTFAGNGAGLTNLTVTGPPAGVTPILAMIWINPATFILGSPSTEPGRSTNEGPQTVVTISKGFWMGHHEVTQGEYQTVVGSNPSFNPYDLNRPVDLVSWNDATNYCRLLTLSERTAGRLPAGWGYRLPTEAEWEYACRAWTTTRFGYGDDLSGTVLTNYAWFSVNGGGGTHPVAQKLANSWGLVDMHGNAGEWCQDFFGAYPGGSVADPHGPGTGLYRVARSGGWFTSAANCRSASRDYGDPAVAYGSGGFRVVLVPGQP